jgi:cyclopropane-fatty-acyl-phospholipid synthase
MNAPTDQGQFMDTLAPRSDVAPSRRRRRDALAQWLLARPIARIEVGVVLGTMVVDLPDGRSKTLGGRLPGPQAHLRLHRWRGLARLVLGGSVGWFRAWNAGEWDSPDPVPVFAIFSANAVTLAEAGRAKGLVRWMQRARHALRHNDRKGSRRNIAAHYDLGNDFYAAWLDRDLHYSSALFDGATRADEALDAAQLRKCDAALDRLALQPGDALLEIGCGWGALGARAIARHDVAYTGLTISSEQAEHAQKMVGDRGTIALRDYRDEAGVYDAIISVEMVEAVGQDYWPVYLDAIAARLKPGGRAAVQFISIDDAIFADYAAGADFIQTYVFPGGCLLSETRFAALATERGLVWQDVAHFSADYAETLRRWRANYELAVAENRLPAQFDAGFHELWRYYLMYCEGGFRGGSIRVGQATLVRAN